MTSSLPPLFAAHIFDGILTLPWILGGFVGAGLLATVAIVIDRIMMGKDDREWDEKDIAQIALLTAAFYVVSLIHIRVGPTSVHLLANGLLGVILRWRVSLAIPVALLLQVLFFGHGGFSTIGINSCIMVVPALAAWLTFDGLKYLVRNDVKVIRFSLVAGSVLIWLASLVFSIALLISHNLFDLQSLNPTQAVNVLCHPVTLLLLVGLSLTAAYLEPKLGGSADFSLGLLIGTLSVLLTMAFNFFALVLGTNENWRSVALLTFIAHMPIAALEGFILGCSVSFLAKVKPSMLRIKPIPPKIQSVEPEPSTPKHIDISEPVPVSSASVSE